MSRGRMQMPGSAARLPYVVATAHSPAPVGAQPVAPGSPVHRVSGSAIRAVSPLNAPQVLLSGQSMRPVQQQLSAKPDANHFVQRAYMTPRMASRPGSPGSPATKLDGDGPAGANGTVLASEVRQPAWAFRSAERHGGDDGSPPPPEMAMRSLRASSPMGVGQAVGSPQVTLASGSRPVQQGVAGNFQTQGRFAPSPTRSHVYHMPRSLSPVSLQQVQMPAQGAPIRAASPVNAVPRSGGFSWTQVPASFSPRDGSPVGVHRAASPMAAVPQPIGFSFKPDAPSGRMLSRNAPRPASPTGQQPPSGAITFPRQAVTATVSTGSTRGQVMARR